LVAAAARLAYGPITAVAATVAMTGTAMLGVALAGRGQAILGLLVAAVALAGVAPAWGWPAFAAAWTAVAVVVVLDHPDPTVALGGPSVA
jgi:hypothetical protein